ncbi:MAG TPA: Hpt domain-containing protein, partial [Allocoleopsis sp.]
MQQEQQQRIMGYFIEEAKDHLNTIEQGLLNLQSTMEDTEMLQEVFRAAHSVKGGAAMLGLTSIQHTSHRLEDYIKVLQESSVKVDRQLESLFLQVFDTLGSLIEQLQGPLGLTDETAGVIMSEAEPVFEELNTHLEQLVKQAEGSPVATAEAVRATATHDDASDALRTHRTFAPTGNGGTSGSGVVPEEPAVASIGRSTNSMESGTHNPLATTPLPVAFKRTVLVQLREMLQLFKQPDSPEHREALQKHCRTLFRLGEEFDLPGWNELIEIVHNAIARPQNSYRQLATLVIKEIKQAQELAVAGRAVEIAPSEQLKSLVPISPTSEPGQPSAIPEEDFDLLFDPNSNPESTTP